ncbi:MAG TPA: tetratricopeptide repeat protein, partial [Abditibacteriaceae bacterium]|jgi:cold shock CspA family protein/tetratricopeptide (TPR) repeat protein
MVLNSLGGVLQRLGRLNEAANTLQRGRDLSVALGDVRGQAMILTTLGGVLRRLERLEEASDVLKQAALIEEQLGNARGQAMVLTTVSSVLQRLGHLKEAVDVLKQAALIEEQLGNMRGQALVFTRLGVVLQRLREADASDEAFWASIAIGERLHDYAHLALARTEFGKSLVSRGDWNAAVEQLRIGFELDLQSRNERGLGIVTPVLVNVLRRLNEDSEANNVINRALKAAPHRASLLHLRERNEADSLEPTCTKGTSVIGRIKRLLAPLGKPRFGFLTPEDGSSDVYFREGTIPTELFSQLSVGDRVSADVTSTQRGVQAFHIRLIVI